jgi:hypothetical protein
MSVKKYSRKKSSYREPFDADSAEEHWSKNELRTVIFVAAQGTVPRSTLASVQRQLPSSDWFEDQYRGRWLPMNDYLSWEEVQIAPSRNITLRELINGILGMKGGVDDEAGIHADDVRTWMSSPDSERLLGEVITMPHTAFGVRLGRRPGSATIELYKRALALCSEPQEKAVFGASICIEDAADVLRRTIYEITPRSIYHSTNGNASVVARALLSHESEVIARGDEIELMKKEGEESETVVISTTLKKEQFLAAIKLPPDAIRWETLKKRTDRKGSLMCDVRSNLREVTLQM